MKGVLFLFTLAIIAVCFINVESRMTIPQIKNALKTVRRACTAKTGVQKELIDGTYDGQFAEDRALMCYFQCAMNMMQMLKNGKFSIAAAAAQADIMLPEDLVDRTKSVVEHCATQITSEDDCEGPWQYAKCNYETDKEVYFFP